MYNRMKLERIYTDQQTGKNFNRPRYQVLKEDVLRYRDELIITEVDRLGRNKQDTLKELQYFIDNNIRVKILELPTTLMDYSKIDNSMAQSEIEKKEKRQREGIQAKKDEVDCPHPITLSLFAAQARQAPLCLHEIGYHELNSQRTINLLPDTFG